ncbi:MAG: hypothetical protein IJM37_10430 [Lachnospiraceae bacterium]|nr:hypothetical protein [Lachnospiraceae bacterium]
MKCKSCFYLYSELDAGLINVCGYEDMTDEEWDMCFENSDACPFFVEDEDGDVCV